MQSPGRERDPLAQESEGVARLLEELRAMVGPSAGQKLEELVHRLAWLYGEGLGRVLNLARQAGAADGRFDALLCDDALVSSLLLLHGLHPLTPAQRVEKALERVRPYLKSHAGGVELVSLDASGLLKLRLHGTCHGCPSSSATIDQLLRGAIEEAVPEVTKIDVEGAPPPPPPLVTLRARSQWTPVPALDALVEGQCRRVQQGGTALLVARLGGELVAYRDTCPSCSASVASGRLDGPALTCGGCGERYQLDRAGRAANEERRPLTPVPLLVEGGVVKVSLEEAGRE